jgi:hypothetical protein
MIVAWSNFMNIKSANLGGVIYVSMLDSNKLDNATQFPATPSYAVYNSTFRFCVADDGGVIYNYNTDYFLIKGSLF